MRALSPKVIIGALLIGVVTGGLLHMVPYNFSHTLLAVFNVIGALFIRSLTMLVVPIVFLSIVGGVSALSSTATIGRLGLRAFSLYTLTTAVALTLSIALAQAMHVGEGMRLVATSSQAIKTTWSWTQLLVQLLPAHVIDAFAQANMLQIILIAVLFGIGLMQSGRSAKPILASMDRWLHVLMRLMSIILTAVPVGVFCLMAHVVGTYGFMILVKLFHYFVVVMLALACQFFLVYGLMLRGWVRVNPITFYRKMAEVFLFAFSVSSSNASIPVVLRAVREQLGVSRATSAFVIPLGATINMDGTAIVGVATVLIANAYQILYH